MVEKITVSFIPKSRFGAESSVEEGFINIYFQQDFSWKNLFTI